MPVRHSVDAQSGGAAGTPPDAPVSNPSDSQPPTPTGGRGEGEVDFNPDARPPHLTVLISRGDLPGNYTWSYRSNYELPACTDEESRILLDEKTEQFVRKKFRPLSGKTLSELDAIDVEGVAKKIYDSTPVSFKRVYWRLRDLARQMGVEFSTIQFISDEPCIPWELMEVYHDDIPSDPELLAVRHSVGRWYRGDNPRLLQFHTVDEVAVAATDYQGIAGVPQLPGALKERDFLVSRLAAKQFPMVGREFVRGLQNREFDLLHLACHGKMILAEPTTSTLTMEDTPNDIHPTMIEHNSVRRNLRGRGPIVFLNACEGGAAASTISVIAGFPAAFLNSGVSLLIAPLWAVDDTCAHEVAVSFYTELQRTPDAAIGEILQRIRARWKEANQLTYLAYVLYGDPNSTIKMPWNT